MIIFKDKLLMYAKGGGGGGAGEVDYPQYMKDFHEDILNNSGNDSMTSSIVDVMNTALGNSPFDSVTAFDPSSEMTAMDTATGSLTTLVNLLSSGNTLDTVIANVLADSRIDDAVDEFSADLDDRLDSEILPRFEAGMRDINAVVSSAFALGKGVIEASHARQVSKYAADLHMKAFSDDALALIALKLEYQKAATHYIVDTNRIKIVAQKEEAEANLDIDEADASWDLGVFQHGANMLASIGGGVMTADKKKKNPTASAIGGALTGAVAGATIGSKVGSVGGGYGALIGAVLGAAVGLLTD